MNARRAAVLAAAGWLAAVPAGAGGPQAQQREESTSEHVKARQEGSAKLLEEAEEKQKEAAEQQEKAADARKEVLEKEKELAEARQKEREELQKAQHLQQQASMAAQKAQQGAQQAHSQASRAQSEAVQRPDGTARRERQVRQSQDAMAASQANQQGTASGGEQQWVEGEVTKVSGSELTVHASDGQAVRLKVDGSTQVTVDGRERSISELQQGAQVRASYSEQGGEKTATRIEATRAADQGTASGK